jgi:hypothetical protein
LVAYYNPLTNATIVSSLKKLTRLYLSGTGLTNASFITGLTNLQTLNLDSNYELTNLAPILALTNLTEVNIGYCGWTNARSITNLHALTRLEVGGLNLTNPAFATSLTNLLVLNLNDNFIGDLHTIAGLSNLNEIQLYNNRLDHIEPLLSLTNLYYANLSRNLLNTNSGSAAMTTIASLATNGVYQNYTVDYSDQQRTPTITVTYGPNDDCAAPGSGAAFTFAAVTSNGQLEYQWQRNGEDLPGQTLHYLILPSVTTANVGRYRVLLKDYSGPSVSEEATLTVVSNCGYTVTIVQQPFS